MSRGPPRPSWKVYNICWGFVATLLGRLILYDGSLCQILVSYYESSNFGQVMDISCHWVEATNLFKLNLLCTHVVRSWCNTQWNLKLKDEGLIFVERCDVHLQPQGLTGSQCLTHLWSAGSFTIPSKFYVMRRTVDPPIIYWIKWHPFQNSLHFPDNGWKNTARLSWTSGNPAPQNHPCEFDKFTAKKLVTFMNTRMA